MGSNKTISPRQLFMMVLLFQQGGLFWLLPYFLVRENGTIGLSAILFGVVAAAAILLVWNYRNDYGNDYGFVTALRQARNGVGAVVGAIFVIWFLLFAIVSLYSFIDVTQKQLLEETPSVFLCLTVILIVGLMSWSGLETIAPMSVFAMAALAVMVVVSVLGNVDLFVLEHALPLQINAPDQLRDAAVHSIFCYSGLLSLFMLYPSVNTEKPLTKSLFLAVGTGAALLVLWTWFALCIFGEYSLQTILWIPAHLARMVQISSFVEQTESLFVVLWMVIVLTNGSLLLWCVSEGAHQLLNKEKNIWLHNMILIVLFFGMFVLHNSMELLQLEAWLAKASLIVLPLLLLAVVLLTAKERNRS